jgi:VWFA-related protein
MRKAFNQAIVVLVVTAVGFAQSPSPAPKQTNDDQVVRIGVTLVQVDAVVTDSAGRQVTDLKPEDFEIFQDGRKQTINNLSYVSTAEPSSVKPDNLQLAVDKSGHPEAVRPLLPSEVKRTIAVVVDDLRMSLDSIPASKVALANFIDTEMEPGDLVAIIRTSGGVGVLQQFTNDKRQLHAAIDSVRWLANGSGGTSSVPSISTRAVNGLPTVFSGYDQYRDDLLVRQTLSVIRHTLSGLSDLPGRKAVVLFSRGFSRFESPMDTSKGWMSAGRVLFDFKILTDMANRASVVIYGMDPQGLQIISRSGGFGGRPLASDLTAADDVSTNPDRLPAMLTTRAQFYYRNQDGLVNLADTTGGFAVINSNDLSGGMHRILNDQKGYYLIGYIPNDSTFRPPLNQPPVFHTITVKVKSARLHVRTRSGFIGVASPEPPPASAATPAISTPRWRHGERVTATNLADVLSSPFNSGDLNVRLTPLFRNSASLGSYVQSLVLVDANGLTFSDEPDGSHKSVVDVTAVLFDDNGQVVDQVVQTESIRLAGEPYKAAMERGVTIGIDLLLKRPDAQQLRVAVRDAATDRIGSARQFIEAPDIKLGRLALSGILLNGKPRDSAAVAGEDNSHPVEPVESANPKEVVLNTDPAIREFRRGKDLVVRFNLAVYNAAINPATGRPQLELQMRLVKDGRQISVSPPVLLKPADNADLKRIAATGTLRLTPDQEPGHYFLQVVVNDAVAPAKYRTASGWSDFEIVDADPSRPRQ